MSPIIPFQVPLRPALPVILGKFDYTEFSTLLHRIDELLLQSGVEKLFIERGMEHAALEQISSGAA